MLIKDKAFLHSINEVGDDKIYNHVQDVDPTLEHVAEEKMWSDNGWTQQRSMRLIGVIPDVTEAWLRKHRPEVMADAKLLKKWLMTEEGRPWRTVTALDTGRKGQAIVK